MTRFLVLVLFLVSLLLVFKRALPYFFVQEVPEKTKPVATEQKTPNKPAKNYVTKTQVFKWTDEKGQVHFSDKSIKEVQAEEVTVTSETTEFKKSPKIRSVYVPTTRQTGNKSARSTKCDNLRKRVADDEAHLKRTTRNHAYVSERLSKNRWRVIKEC